MALVRTILAAGILLTFTTVADAQNCCLPRMGDEPESARLVSAIQTATLVLLAAPPMLIGGIALWMGRGLYRSHEEYDEPGDHDTKD